MAYFAIAFIAPNYRDYSNQWLKAYEPGTTTPKAMALDSAAAVTVAKLQLNADGFLKSAGDALVIPYIEGAYDLWLFPTSAEADANDTSSAVRVADDINASGSGGELSQAYEFATVAAMTASTLTFPVGKVLKTKGYYSINDGGGAEYIVSTTVSVDGFGDHVITGAVAILKTDGWVNAKQYGLKGDRTTDDSAAEAALSVSSHLFIYFPSGIFRTNVNNGTSNRTYLFADNCIIDGVIHITGVGPATVPVQSLSFVENVRMLGTATSTIRFGTFYVKKLNVDKIRITEVSTSYLNQTAVGGSTGVHLYFGTKEMECGEIICDSGALNYNLQSTKDQ